MVLLFADDQLKRLCSEERLAKRRLGASGARKLRARLADLDAAATPSDLVAGRPHPLKGLAKASSPWILMAAAGWCSSRPTNP